MTSFLIILSITLLFILGGIATDLVLKPKTNRRKPTRHIQPIIFR